MFLNIRTQVNNLCVLVLWAFVHMSAEKRRKVNHQAVSLRFVGYLVGFKGKKFWEPEGNMFVELAHAKWSTLHTSEQPLRSETIPQHKD